MDLAEKKSLLRLIDANLNRALEGLRTLEDLARFICNDQELSAQLKELRHGMVQCGSFWQRGELLAARDVAHDVGATIKTESEAKRSDLSAIAAAAAGRAQQSLRVLEEVSKQDAPQVAKNFEAMRYNSYRIAAQLETRLIRREKLVHARLYLLTDAARSETELYDRVARYAEAGVHVIQLRAKEFDDATLYRRAETACKARQGTQTLLIINDRADIAVAAEADGVHLGQTELPATAARRVVGRDRIIGISTHGIEQALSAVKDGADYLGCGPTFPSTTKSFDQYVGTQYLTEVVTQIALPAFAIGGIDLDNLHRVLETGIGRIAVSAVVQNANDPVAVIRQLLHRLDEAALPKFTKEVHHEDPRTTK